ncbi:MAG TPA: hypothetical protein VFE33_09145 [Thermoanaerobaculia bacterium]|nr:hypothetical protein [Thermoanaerobaculia bacterium]
MIRVPLQPEPTDFDERVRQPGLQALATHPKKLPRHWGRCAVQLWEAYKGICAYLCVIIPRGTGARSVDHLAPKSSHPDLAYEWSNYRLVCSLMNSRKRDFEDALDPFEIPDGWFALDLSFLKIFPNPDLDEETCDRVKATIDRLRLDDEECRAARAMYYDAYLGGRLTFDLLEEWSPFVARELRRQGLYPTA